MNKITQLIIVIVVAMISGCADKPVPTGIPIWDYERDGGTKDVNLTFPGAVIGARTRGIDGINGFGGLFGSISASNGLGELDLTPKNLQSLILTTLTESSSQSLPPSRFVPKNTLAPVDTSKTQTKPLWNITESNEGQITTDWEDIPGRTTGLFWWRKIYQTEVRHIVTINRSYLFSNSSNFTITTEVRERPNSLYDWSSGDPELGRKSFENIKNTLFKAIRNVLENNSVNLNSQIRRN